MEIRFQKRRCTRAPGLEFTWMLSIDAGQETRIADTFIPELFFDTLFIRKGRIHCVQGVGNRACTLARHTLKTLHTHSFTFTYSLPLQLFGARLSLPFADHFWEQEMKANDFIMLDWVPADVQDLAAYETQLVQTINRRAQRKHPGPMFARELEESDWLRSYSPRHKRRLYKSTLGVSRRDLHSIGNVHSFLKQTCDFAAEMPAIIDHVNAGIFYDQPHLNRTFKRMTGLSPLQYFEVNSILQDNLLAVSYNEVGPGSVTI